MPAMSIASQNALVGRSYIILAFHFPYDESFEEIDEDLDIPAHEGRAIMKKSKIVLGAMTSQSSSHLLPCLCKVGMIVLAIK